MFTTAMLAPLPLPPSNLDCLVMSPDSAQAEPRQVPAQIGWPGPQIKTHLPFRLLSSMANCTVYPSIPYACSTLLTLILFSLLLQSFLSCRGEWHAGTNLRL